MVCTESVWLFLNWMPTIVLKRVCDVFVSSHNLLINLIKSFESCITDRSIMALCVCFSSLLVFLSSMYLVDMSQIMRKNMLLHIRKQRCRSAVQLLRNDQHLCFHYIESTIPLIA